MYIRTALMLAAAMFVLSGCEQEGPAERAGEALDDAVGDIRDHAEETCEEVADAADAHDVDCG